MQTNLPIELLRTFLAIAEGGSFSLAGEQVHRSQSAVSMQMKRLEELVGKPLLTRDRQSRQPAKLTSEGLMLAGYARRILKLNEEAIATLQKPEITGWVRIGLPDDYANRFLPEILAGFSRTHPLVQVEVRCEPSSQLKPLIRRGELDLAITTSIDPMGENALVLRRDPAVWVTSNQHLTHEERPLPLALFPRDCFFRTWALQALDQAGIDYRIAYTSPSIMGLQAAASAGLAVTVISQCIVPDGLRQLTPKEGFPPLPYASFVLHRSPQDQNPAVESLADHIVQTFDLCARPLETAVVG